MSNELNKLTEQFRKQVEDLILEGKVANRQQIVEDLGWDKSMMSQVMRGIKNVPFAVYQKFTQLYGMEENPPPEAKNSPTNDITSKYIALLEANAKAQANSEKEILRGLKLNQALLMTLQEAAARLLAKSERKDVIEIGDQLNKVTEGNLRQAGIL